jgi:hypothetical protein
MYFSNLKCFEIVSGVTSFVPLSSKFLKYIINLYVGTDRYFLLKVIVVLGRWSSNTGVVFEFWRVL